MTTASREGAPGVLRLVLLGQPRLCGVLRTTAANAATAAADHALERRSAALLALLAFNGATPRQHAAALVWPQADDKHASNSLRQRIFKLRQAAGRDVIVGDRQIALAADLVHDLGAPAPLLAENPESLQGALLGTLDYADCRDLDQWVAVARQRWRDEMARALAEIASQRECQGRIAAALRLAERLVEVEPTQEHAHRRLMRLHYLRGDRAAALAAFDRCRLVLRAELGVLPDRETQDLQQMIESSAASLVRSTAARPVTLLRPPRLVGREAEWGRLQRALAEPRTLLVLGEAGIGKSRLLADFVAAHGGRVVAARPGDAGIAYATLARWLRAAFEAGAPLPEAAVRSELARILPEWGGSPSGPLQPVKLRGVVESLWATGAPAATPQLWALDDAQFADAATLELLPALLPALMRSSATPGAGDAPRARWLIASRAAELPPALKDWSRALDASGLSQLVLGPLDESGVLALLESLALPGFDAARWAPALVRHTGGNPLFVLETLRGVLDGAAGGAMPAAEMPLPLPADVGNLIERRLDQLSPDALALARVAALAGQDFSPELAAGVLERRVIDLAEPWRELQTAQVIREDAFAHDLILEATQRSVPRPIARALHATIARALADAGTPAATQRCAEHYRQAEHWAQAAGHFEAAARQAQSASARTLEAQLWHSAIACHRRAGQPEQALEAGLQSVDALMIAGSAAQARAAVDALASEAQAPQQRLRAALLQAYACLLVGDVAAATAAAARGLALAREAGDTAREIEAAGMQAMALALSGRSGEGAALLDGLRSAALALPGARQRFKYWSDLAYVLQYTSRRRDCLAALTEAIPLAEGFDDQAELMTVLANAAQISAALGLAEQAVALGTRAVGLVERIGDPRSTTGGNSYLTLAAACATTGQPARALALYERAAAAMAAADNPIFTLSMQNNLAALYLRLGQTARAVQSLQGDYTQAMAATQLRQRVLLAQAERAGGGRGRHTLDDAAALVQQAHEPAIALLWRIERARAAADAQALAELDAAADEAERFELVAMALRARLVRIEAGLRLTGAAVPVADLDATAQALGALYPADMSRAEGHWILAQAFQHAGQTARAADHGSRARALLEGELREVPPAFADSFRHRNPVHRMIFAHTAAAGRERE